MSQPTAATIILVRHALAGRRSEWHGPDHMRPLDEAGRQQATAIAATLTELGPDRLYSSSYVRCIETFETFAVTSGLQIEVHAALAEGTPASDVEAFLAGLSGHVALCTHGDICHLVTAWAVGVGLSVPADAETDKGAMWILDRAEGSARLVPAPDVVAEQA